MASTISDANLTITITERVILNGRDQGSSNELVISGVNEVYKRIVRCPANAETTLAHFHSSVADGTLAPLDIDNVKYTKEFLKRMEILDRLRGQNLFDVLPELQQLGEQHENNQEKK